jgi:hypothetical protein
MNNALTMSIEDIVANTMDWHGVVKFFVSLKVGRIASHVFSAGRVENPEFVLGDCFVDANGVATVLLLVPVEIWCLGILRRELSLRIVSLLDELGSQDRVFC